MKPCVAIFPWGDVVEDFLGPIGLDAQGFADRMSGGWLFGYVAALQSAGWRPIIVCASQSLSTPTRVTHKATGAAIWLVPGRSVKQGKSPSLHALRRWLASPMQAFAKVLIDESCAAIIVQEYEYTRFDQLVRLGRSKRIPVFASFQGGDRPWSPLEAKVRPSSLRRATGLIIASSAERARVAAAYPKAAPPVANIPNPLDTEEWRPIDRLEARRQLGIDPDAFLVVNHGRISIGRKGLDVLLDAWDLCEGGKLVIIGSGEDDAAFAELLAQHQSPSVEWLAGYSTDRALMRAWLSAADIYVTASRIEGMPVAPLEAMACGLPIIATDAQGLPDILEDGEASGGLMVPKDDAQALAAAITRLRKDRDLRHRLGAAARRRVEAQFSILGVGAQLAALLSNAVGLEN